MAIVREIVNAINESGKMYPILAISGPRQSGKTTMLKKFDYKSARILTYNFFLRPPLPFAKREY